MGGEDVAPGFEPLTGQARWHLLGFGHPPGLGLEAGPLVVQPDPPDGIRLIGGPSSGEQALHRVERPIGVVSREGVVVRVSIPDIAQLGCERLLHAAEFTGEDAPVLGEDPQQERGVVLAQASGLAVLCLITSSDEPHPVSANLAGRRGHPRLDEGQEPLGEQFQALADSIPIAQRCHVSSSSSLPLTFRPGHRQDPSLPAPAPGALERRRLGHTEFLSHPSDCPAW